VIFIFFHFFDFTTKPHYGHGNHAIDLFVFDGNKITENKKVSNFSQISVRGEKKFSVDTQTCKLNFFSFLKIFISSTELVHFFFSFPTEFQSNLFYSFFTLLLLFFTYFLLITFIINILYKIINSS